MKFRVVLVFVFVFFSSLTYAKKDIEAWKNEQNLKNQFSVFKQNLNLWDGYMFFKEYQIDDLFKAVNDSVSKMQINLSQSNNKISELNTSISALNSKLRDVQDQLDQSLTREDSFSTFGISMSKGSFSFFMYSITAILLIVLAVIGLMFKQNFSETREAKEKYEDLYKEYENHKKNNLERITKINKDLHDAKMRLGEL